MPRTPEQNIAIRAKTREKILKSSMKLFGQKGFEQTSVNTIAKEAGISKGLIYNHFETKEDIVEGVVYMLMDHGDKILTPNNELESPKHQLKSIIDETFKWMDKESELMAWMLPMAFQIGRYPFVTNIVATKIKTTISKSVDLFSRLGFDQPEEEAWYFGAIMDGIGMDHILVENYDRNKMHKYLLTKYELNNL